MKKITPLFIALVVASLTPLLAEQAQLCGQSQAKVCLQNSTAFQFQSSVAMVAGSAVVIKLPGIESTAVLQGEGSPTVSYRMETAGSVNDDQGGSWSSPQLVLGEQDAAWSLAFVLEAGHLVNPIIRLNDIRVCQRVVDGAVGVVLDIQVWLVHAKGKKAESALKLQKTGDAFETCQAYTGHAPVFGRDADLWVSNPHAEPASLEINNVILSMEPNSQVSLKSLFEDGPHRVRSNVPLPMVVVDESRELNLIGVNSKDNTDYIIAHLARDTGNWTNEWVMATGEGTLLEWAQGNDTHSTVLERGLHRLPLDVSKDNASGWARLNGSRAINGYFEFSRVDGSGSAGVNALRLSEHPSYGEHQLVLPHVAADRANFWTGFSIANPNQTRAQVSLYAYGSDGLLLQREDLSIEPQANSLGLIGQTHMLGVAGISWIRIDSNQPIAGLELIGRHGSRGALAGFLLPSEKSERLVFPLLKADSQWWSGLSVLNHSQETNPVEMRYYSSTGTLIQQQTMSLAPGQKALFLAPPGSEHARVDGGAGLVGFCLVGDYAQQKMGGYLGM